MCWNAKLVGSFCAHILGQVNLKKGCTFSAQSPGWWNPGVHWHPAAVSSGWVIKRRTHPVLGVDGAAPFVCVCACKKRIPSPSDANATMKRGVVREQISVGFFYPWVAFFWCLLSLAIPTAVRYFDDAKRIIPASTKKERKKQRNSFSVFVQCMHKTLWRCAVFFFAFFLLLVVAASECAVNRINLWKHFSRLLLLIITTRQAAAGKRGHCLWTSEAKRLACKVGNRKTMRNRETLVAGAV